MYANIMDPCALRFVRICGTSIVVAYHWFGPLHSMHP